MSLLFDNPLSIIVPWGRKVKKWQVWGRNARQGGQFCILGGPGLPFWAKILGKRGVLAVTFCPICDILQKNCRSGSFHLKTIIMPTIQFVFSNQLSKQFATADGGPRFYIGSDVVYQGNHGLSNLQLVKGQVYAPASYEAPFGFWADFIYPTAMCESKGSFHCLNTYDRAAFTFTFMQFAAHVPNGDFVTYLRRLLALPKAKDYFPFLELRNGHVWYDNGTSANQLESDGSTQALMNYLNPDRANLDRQELISAARMVHWSQNDPANRELQVSCAVELFKKNMRQNNIRYNLNGWPDYICQAICDIHHQGRAKVSHITGILTATTNRQTIYTNLLNVGAGVYAERIRTLKATHKQLMDAGKFGKKVYNSASNDFVDV
jgi:hypothetical protein